MKKEEKEPTTDELGYDLEQPVPKIMPTDNGKLGTICYTCDGYGQIKEDGKKKRCETCKGSGLL